MSSLNSILITGGAGYVGSVLVKKLVNLNYDVRVIDSLVFEVLIQHFLQHFLM